MLKEQLPFIPKLPSNTNPLMFYKVANKTSYRKIAKKTGLALSTVFRLAKIDPWMMQKERIYILFRIQLGIEVDLAGWVRRHVFPETLTTRQY